MVAFTWALGVTVVMTLGILWYARRRPVGKTLTWAEAMMASTYVFALMFVAYGVLPHQWLMWADNELNWRPDRMLLETYPIKVSYLVLRDLIVVGLYVVLLGANIALWAMWQNRGKKAAKPAELPVSSFGRPLVAKAND